MPKKINSHKAAAQSLRLSTSLEEALAGKYEVGIVENALGNSSFRIRIGDKLRVVAITSAVLRGGAKSKSHASVGHYLIVDGSEVQGVVNTQADLRALKKAGRITRVVTVEEAVNDLFDYEGHEEAAQDIWAGVGKGESRKEREARLHGEANIAELRARILARRAGLLAKAKELEIGSDAEEEEIVEPQDLEEAEEEASGLSSTRSPRNRSTLNRAERRAAALAEAAALALEAEALSASAAAWSAAGTSATDADADLERHVAAFAIASAAAGDDWESLIDAI